MYVHRLGWDVTSPTPLPVLVVDSLSVWVSANSVTALSTDVFVPGFLFHLICYVGGWHASSCSVLFVDMSLVVVLSDFN